MKVLLINGSSHKEGSTYRALKEVAGVLEGQNIDTEIIQLGGEPLRDCIGCFACKKNPGKCIFDDDMVNATIKKAQEADGFIFGSPVYYAHPTGRILSFLDRMCFAGGQYLAGKPGAAIVCARRAGTTAALDVLNKYFTILQMPVASSQYWNMVHGMTAEDIEQDAEGLQTMRTLGLRMAWLMKSLKAAKEAGVEMPEQEEKVMTNFIR